MDNRGQHDSLTEPVLPSLHAAGHVWLYCIVLSDRYGTLPAM